MFIIKLLNTLRKTYGIVCVLITGLNLFSFSSNEIIARIVCIQKN